MDAIVHDSRMLLRRYGRNPNYVMVSVDASNAFNSFSHQSLLERLPLQTPSLALFYNLIYGRTVPYLVLSSTPLHLMPSRGRTQKGDPASMLLSSLAIQPLVRRLRQECRLALNRWYADDGTLIIPIAKVAKALRILRDEGPAAGFQINIAKSRAYWPSATPENMSRLLHTFPLQVPDEEGLVLLGAPLGTGAFVRQHLMQKVYSCHTYLGLLDDIPDSRIRFHLHRVTGSVFRVEHVFRLKPPELSLAAAHKFDELQMSAYSRLNDIPVSPSIATHVRLPLSLGGHGFTALSPFVYASHAASLIESATVRVKGPNNPSEPFYRSMPRRFLVHVIGIYES